MAIGKMLKLGGLENSLSNTNPSPNKFKIANNVSFNKDGFITPRYPLTGHTGSFVRYYSLISNYVSDSNIFSFGVNASDNHTAYYNGSLIPGAEDLGSHGTSYPNNNFSEQSFEINKVRYVLAGAGTLYSRLYKYDGYEIYNAGIPSPYVVPAPEAFGAAGYSPSGSRFVKVINHTIDMQGNTLASDTVKYRTNGSIQNFTGMVFGNNMFVGVGERGINYSYDGINWDSAGRCVFTTIAGTVIDFFPLHSIAYGTVGGKPMFVAVSESTLLEYGIAISSDGINWRQPELPLLNQSWQGVAFGNGIFSIVNNTGINTGTRALWSSDGEDWNFTGGLPNLNNWSCLAFGNGVFVALSNTGTGNRCMTSTDATVWTARTTPVDNNWTSLVYGNGTWVAVASNGLVSNQVMTNPSPESGTLWSIRTISALNTWTSITFGTDGTTNYFVAMAAAAATANKFMRSADNGVTWTLYAGINALVGSCVCFGAPVTGTSTSRLFVSGTTDITANTTLNLSYTLYPPTGVWVQGESPITTKLSITESFSAVDEFYAATGNTVPYTEPGGGNNDYFFYGTIAYTGSFFTTDIANPIVGDWGVADVGAIGSYLIRTINFSSTNKNYSAAAYKIRTTSPLTFEGSVLGFNSSTLLWETINASLYTTVLDGTFIASKRFSTVWASASATGVYYFKGMFNSSSAYSPIVGSSVKQTFSIDIRSTVLANRVRLATDLPFSISGTLNDWYDVFSIKTSFNSLVGKEIMVSMTNYLDSLVIATPDLLYFSDPTLGGSIEMTSALSFAKIGDSEKGAQTSIVGTKDYIIVSRERKVYMVAGVLSTQNYRVQEIPGLALGAYSNSCMLEVDGNVMILTSNGVWLINAANITPLSEGIGLNFRSYFPVYLPSLPSQEQNAVTFTMTNYPPTAWSDANSKSGNYIVSMYDPYKRIVVFTDNSRTTACGKSLVFHFSNGEWTTWDSYVDLSASPNTQITSMAAIKGVIYMGRSSNYSGPSSDQGYIYKEDVNFGTSVLTYEYATRSPPRLSTTWISAGEPSLEKQLLQLKIYGYLFGNLNIKHYQNWNLTTAITNSSFTPISNYTYFHKKRLNSSKVLSTSIEISIPSNGNAFWIEGIEVEFEPIQVGMKR